MLQSENVRLTQSWTAEPDTHSHARSCKTPRELDCKTNAYFHSIWHFITVILHHISGPPQWETKHTAHEAPISSINCVPGMIIFTLASAVSDWFTSLVLESLITALLHLSARYNTELLSWFMVFGQNYNKCSSELTYLSSADERWSKMNGQTLKKNSLLMSQQMKSQPYLSLQCVICLCRLIIHY